MVCISRRAEQFDARYICGSGTVGGQRPVVARESAPCANEPAWSGNLGNKIRDFKYGIRISDKESNGK